MTKAEAVQELEDEIMDTFEFAKVANYMKSVNWSWASATSEMDVPAEPQLRAMVRSLIRQAAKRKESIGTGGFHIDYREGMDCIEDKPYVSIDLSFKIAQSNLDGVSYDEPKPNKLVEA